MTLSAARAIGDGLAPRPPAVQVLADELLGGDMKDNGEEGCVRRYYNRISTGEE